MSKMQQEGYQNWAPSNLLGSEPIEPNGLNSLNKKVSKKAYRTRHVKGIAHNWKTTINLQPKIAPQRSGYDLQELIMESGEEGG